MTTVNITTANSSPLKRSFDALGPEIFADYNPLTRNGTRIPSVGSFEHRNRPVPPSVKRRSISYSGPSTMTVGSNSIIETTFPSFMAVFGGSESANVQEDARQGGPQTQAQHGIRLPLTGKTQAQTKAHYFTHSSLQHRDSINSFASHSTTSSPTTTISTFDSPSITDPSPSSSPESPTSALPLSPFSKMMRSQEELTIPNGGRILHTAEPLSYQTQSDPQFSSMKNVKNLSLNIAVATPARPATSSSFDTFHALPTPNSPLREPLRTGRRKPPNLTIRTPGLDQLTFVRTAPEIPPTPSSRPQLLQIQSSPALNSLMSPSLGPLGGMNLPMPPFLHGHSRSGSQSGSQSSLATQSVTSSLGDVKEENQPLRSQEAPERGYTNGPIQIYDSGVYLYLEPTAEEASRFDTVINVAKEVKNPFQDLDSEPNSIMSVWRAKDDRSKIPEPQTAISEISFKSAFEWPLSTASDMITPTTPTQTSSSKSKEPEYIHVPWDHNSEIINDLFPLCKLIDDRVSSGYTVLIHCQLGVSRSASLVIAYGLYKGHQSTFPTMYDAVKARSRWVGPNMSLIYQLGDFRRQVERQEHTKKGREAADHWFKNGRRYPNKSAQQKLAESTPKPTATSTTALSERPAVPPKVSQPLRLNKKLPPVPLFSETPIKEKAPQLPILPPATYQPPSSITPSSSSQLKTSRNLSPATTTVTRPLPLREHLGATRVIPPHRPRKEAPSGLVISRPAPQMDLAMQDVPQTPSLFSPRVTEFMASPFAMTTAGDLHTPCTLTIPRGGLLAGEASPDPRSPHQRDDAGEILRSIDDVL